MLTQLKAQLYRTVRGHKQKSVEQLAHEMGISANYLYRSTDDSESGCRFPLELLIPLMQAAKNFRALDHLNARCGRISVSLPRVGRLKREDPHAINDTNQRFHAAMASLLDFFARPEASKAPQIEEQLYGVLCDVAALRRAVQTFAQRELF